MSGTTLEEKDGSAEWKHGLFACLEDKKTCVAGCCVPCFVIGKNAEAMGENCLLHGLLSCVGLNFGPVLRYRLRKEKNIKGSMLMDALVYMVTPCCAMIQEAREANWEMPEQVNQAAAKVQDMTRE